jgi:hypothetical protein
VTVAVYGIVELDEKPAWVLEESPEVAGGLQRVSSMLFIRV